MWPRVIHRDPWSKYEFSKLLGEGASGKVFLATSINTPNANTHKVVDHDVVSRSVAVKILDKHKITSTTHGIMNLI